MQKKVVEKRKTSEEKFLGTFIAGGKRKYSET